MGVNIHLGGIAKVSTRVLNDVVSIQYTGRTAKNNAKRIIA